jgi:hypothetical protein
MSGSFAALPKQASLMMKAVWALAGGALAVLIEHLLAGEFLKKPVPWLVVFGIACFALTCYLVYLILARIEELYLRSRLSIRYLPLPVGDSIAAEKVYREARRMVERANTKGECEIVAVNSFGPKFDDPDDIRAESAHDGYFKAFEERLGTVDYHRIVQYEGIDSTILRDYLSRSYERHFAAVVKYRDEHQASGRSTRLDCVPLRYPTSYAVVDNRGADAYLFWQLNECISRDNKNVFRPRGFLIVADPERQLVRYFKEWFTTLANNPKLRAIAAEEIAAQTATSSG